MKSPESGQTCWNGSSLPFYFRNRPYLGPLFLDLFASRPLSQLPLFVSWRLDPPGSGHRCLCSGLEHPSREIVCANPPWSLIGRVLSLLHSQGVQELVPVAQVWKAQAWYTMLLQLLVRVSILIPRLPDTIQSVWLNNLPDITPQLAMPVNYIHQQCEGSYLSQTATDLVLSSWMDKSTKSYNSSLRKRASWCAEWNKNPISDPISDIADFLAKLYKKGYQHRSLNAYCSAISSTHEKVDGQMVGQHPTIVRVLKGAYNKRPPYQVLHYMGSVQGHSYIVSLGENDALTLNLLSPWHCWL